VTVAVICWYQQLEVRNFLVINERRHFRSPRLERLFFLHVIEIVVDGAGLRDLSTFKELADNVIKALLASLIKGGTHSPNVTPGVDRIKELLLFIICSLEALVDVEVDFEEITDGYNLLQVHCLDWLSQSVSDLFKTNVNSGIKVRVDEFSKVVREDFIIEECVQPGPNKRSPPEFLVGHVNHAAAGHSGWGCHR